MTKEKTDLHQVITDSIIAAIERGTSKVALPWHRAGCSFIPQNAVTTADYRGINVLSLWAVAEARGYERSVWATYKQWASIDARVRKGEKAALVVFYKQYQGDADPEDADDTGLRRVAKASWVFNAAQVDGYAVGPIAEPLPPLQKLASVEAFVRNTSARVLEGGDRAYYAPVSDHIQMPDEALFRRDRRLEDWYSVLCHELGHWSGASTRLARTFGKRFGDDAYCMEELCAELTASFLCAELGISMAVREDHAHYIGHWLRVLKADNRAVFAAAAKASEAVRYLRSFSVQAAHAV